MAVFGIAVVALTGARGSHGGGCGGGSSSSSSSGGDSSSSTTGGSDSGSSSSGSTTGSGSGTGGSSAASRDLRIADCKYDPSRGLIAGITATNSSSSQSYTYNFTVKFTNGGSAVGTRTASISAVAPGRSQTSEVTTPYVKKESESLVGRCEVKYVTRTSS
ncbi:hypothetical protein ACIQM4_14440 [Streptomyces sp. NPDC091272]|uniref:hypothetical protein n=1 Tax=Streptomyces sp. NPDC091272 TaxID=3365981 RepID=UPI003817B06C